MARNSNDLTTNGELLDQLVLSASCGSSIALEALEVRYGVVVTSAVRARMLATQNRFISNTSAWAAAARAITRVGDSEQPFIAWLALATDEAAGVPSDDADEASPSDDGLADADRCAFELHVMGYGSTEIASVLGETRDNVRTRIENAKQQLLARALAKSGD